MYNPFVDKTNKAIFLFLMPYKQGKIIIGSTDTKICTVFLQIFVIMSSVFDEIELLRLLLLGG